MLRERENPANKVGLAAVELKTINYVTAKDAVINLVLWKNLFSSLRRIEKEP